MNEYRIFGPPGTGKTTYLSGQVARAAEAHGGENVAVASFTRAAASELAGRELPLPEDRVGTLHAFCYRALGRPKIAEANTASWNDNHPHWAVGKSTVAAEDVAATEPSGDSGGEPLLQAIGTLRARRIPLHKWPAEAQTFYSSWREWKEREGYLDFTDLIETTLERGGPMPGRPTVGFFDEVQDFTALELELVRSWAKHMETCVLAGDDDQCIYAFKGATPDAFLNPPLPDSHKRVLGQSWRLPSAIVEASAAWIEKVSRREPKPFSPQREGGHVGGVQSRLSDLGRDVSELALEAMRGGPTLMILASCSYMLAPVIAQLRDMDLTWHNPYRRANPTWNPFTPDKGTGTMVRLSHFFRTDGAWDQGYPVWEMADFAAWTPLLAVSKAFKSGGGKALEHAITFPYQSAIDARDGVVRFCRQWMRDGVYTSLLKAASTGDISALIDVCETKRVKSVERSGTLSSLWGQDILTATPRIIVGTVHSVKGGEADNVVLYPDISPKMSVDMFMRRAESVYSMRRAMYVGMTRARNALYLGKPMSPRFIDWDGLDK